MVSLRSVCIICKARGKIDNRQSVYWWTFHKVFVTEIPNGYLLHTRIPWNYLISWGTTFVNWGFLLIRGNVILCMLRFSVPVGILNLLNFVFVQDVKPYVRATKKLSHQNSNTCNSTVTQNKWFQRKQKY